MSTLGFYSGPGKAYFNSLGLQAEGENGVINVVVTETVKDIANAIGGKLGNQLLDQTAEISIKPFDNWNLLPTMFPPYLGVTTAVGTGFGAGVLAIGTRPHNPAASSDLLLKIFNPSMTTLHSIKRAAVTGHPSLHLGVGKALYGDVKFTAIGATGVALGAGGYLYTSDAITETGASDPGGPMMMSDFVRETWGGVWGTVAGFGGAASSLGVTAAIQAEDEWTIESQIKYSPLKVQDRTMAYKLDSVSFMAKCKPYGPSQTDILAAMAAHSQGQRLGSADLVLTSGLAAKVITLKNAEIKGGGFIFGGTTLGMGEIGFVNFATITTGAINPLLTFSV